MLSTGPDAWRAVLGRVRGVAVYPVKGADGAPVDRLRFDADGVLGDRRHVLVDDQGRTLTADRVPQLRTVAARLDGGTLRLDVDGIARDLAGADAEAALTAFLGRTVRLLPVAPGSQLDAPVHLVSVQAVEAALRGEHEVAGCACSLREPRANLVLELASEDPSRWEGSLAGRLVAVGSAVLRVQRRPGHCLGMYAAVVTPGDVVVGDEVGLVNA